MSCTLSHECRVMLIAELLTASTDATRGWLRAEMDRTVDPMLDSIFNRLKTKLTNGLERTQSGDAGDYEQVVNENQNFYKQSANVQVYQPSTSSFNPTSSHINPQFVNINNSYQQQQQNGPNHLHSISNQQLSSQSQPMTIKEEIEPMPTHQVQSCSYASVSNEQSNHNLTDQNRNNDDHEDENSQTNLPDTEFQPQYQQFGSIKHNQFDDKECDCNECVDGGIEVKEEDDEDDNDEYDQLDEELCRTVKRPRMDTTQSNNAQKEVDKQSQKQSTDEAQSNEDKPDGEGDQMGSGQSEGEYRNVVINNITRDELTENEQIDDDEDSEEEIDANNPIGDAIATEYTTNPIQPNLAQSYRHLQCSQCHKSFDRRSKLQLHLRVHTGERPFQCDLCDKQFNVRSNLMRHQLIHQNIKRFRCHECDKQFTHKNTLESHLRTHSGERPFACRHCEKSFTQLVHRNRHEQAIHLHVKPYRCKQCGHTATQRASIIRHIRQVHFGLPHSIKEQQTRNIIDERDPRELVEKV